MRTITAFFVLASMLPGQRTWVVRCTPGPGVDFTDLPPAVAAASAGDTILLVWDSTCATIRYRGTVIDKALSLIGVGAYQVGAAVDGLIEIRGISSGQSVLIANIGIDLYSTQSTPHGFDVHDCSGEVHLENVRYRSSGSTNGIMHFVDCSHVTLHWCELQAPGSPVWVTPFNLLPAPECSILFRRSTATLVECGLFSAWPNAPGIAGFINEPADALYLDHSNVTLIDTQVVGAGRFEENYRVYWWERRAITQDGGALTIGPATTLSGGYYWNGISRVPVEAIRSINNGTIVQDPVTYDTGCYPCPQRVTRVVPAVMMERAFRNRSYRVQVRGQAGDFTLLGLGGYAPVGAPTPFGQLLLDPNWLMIVSCAQISSLGVFDFAFQMHPAVPMNAILGFQAGLIHGNGGIELSLPAAFSVLWEPGRTFP